MSALVKAIVPCYRYAELLPGCVGSLLGQRGVEVRVLILDDCSPDDTPRAAEPLLADPRVEYRRHLRNRGLVATANEGLEWAADSDCTLLISADDLLLPGALARAAAALARHPSVGLVYGRAPYLREGAPPGARGRPLGTKVWAGEDWIRRRCRSGHNCISSPEAVVRTSVLRRVGGYDPACRHASDLNLWLRVAAAADVAHIRGAPQALYRVHGDGMLREMLSGPGGELRDLRERRAAFERFFAASAARLRDPVGLCALAQRALARQALWRASRAYDRGEVGSPGAPDVERLVAFALETCPRAQRLPEWHGLRLRRALGNGRSLRRAPFLLLTGAGHRARHLAARGRRHLTGA